MKTILSLFDYSGVWSQPYFDAGYDVICFDIQNGQDINNFCVDHLLDEWGLGLVHGILAAVPCTDFSGSGARWWRDKDQRGDTQLSIELVNQVLRTVELFDPAWWVIENPVGRLNRLVPGLSEYGPWYFQPCDFGDPYTKKTGLWGVYTQPNAATLGADWSVRPTQGSKMWSCFGGKSLRTKNRRSMTPPGFAQAFFQCNP